MNKMAALAFIAVWLLASLAVGFIWGRLTAAGARHLPPERCDVPLNAANAHRSRCVGTWGR